MQLSCPTNPKCAGNPPGDLPFQDRKPQELTHHVYKGVLEWADNTNLPHQGLFLVKDHQMLSANIGPLGHPPCTAAYPIVLQQIVSGRKAEVGLSILPEHLLTHRGARMKGLWTRCNLLDLNCKGCASGNRLNIQRLSHSASNNTPSILRQVHATRVPGATPHTSFM